MIEADGGTRTAAITAAFVAVADALRVTFGKAAHGILTDSIAAVSAGIVDGEPVVDLDYVEDSKAEVDMNVVRLGGGGLVEVQGTGEHGTFSRAQLDDPARPGRGRDRPAQAAPARGAGGGLAV